MSIKSWKAEFYPVEADEVSAEDALAHSLKKWQGLQEESLLKHGLVKCADGVKIEDDNERRFFKTSSDTCALCVHHHKTDGDGEYCGDCPLFKLRGRSCDGYDCGEDGDEDEDEDEISPWLAWVEYNDPKPMIALLEEAISQQNPVRSSVSSE